MLVYFLNICILVFWFDKIATSDVGTASKQTVTNDTINIKFLICLLTDGFIRQLLRRANSVMKMFFVQAF